MLNRIANDHLPDHRVGRTSKTKRKVTKQVVHSTCWLGWWRRGGRLAEWDRMQCLLPFRDVARKIRTGFVTSVSWWSPEFANNLHLAKRSRLKCNFLLRHNTNSATHARLTKLTRNWERVFGQARAWFYKGNYFTPLLFNCANRRTIFEMYLIVLCLKSERNA